jgi:divalent metal cation (Fe/Co/Zn/Cd) transporter
MTGSIRAFVGFLIAFGAVGQSDFDPSTPVLQTIVVAVIGLLIMYSGARAMKGSFDE